MDLDSSDDFEEEIDLYDEYERDAAIRILELISQLLVVTDRELKVRLEREFFPWVTGRTVNRLIRGLEVDIAHSPGRKGGMGTPENFYKDTSVNYDTILKSLLKKRRISSYVNSLLTRLSPAGRYAEDVFGRAFDTLKFKIVDRDASKFGNKTVQSVSGKQPPDLDFIIKRDHLTYGVDIKNWIKYEFDSISDVMDKVDIAVQLGIIPFICARYVDKGTLFRITEIPGIVYRYETLILPPEFRSLAEEATAYLGYPILTTEVLPSYKLAFIEKLHHLMLKRVRKEK